jgi:hypothetical protein
MVEDSRVRIETDDVGGRLQEGPLGVGTVGRGVFSMCWSVSAFLAALPR